VLPGLQDARELARLNPDSHAARVLATRLTRQRNRVLYHLTHAADTLDTAIDELQAH
jgi:hypothetical protein